MLISHRYRFIFLKTEKTASTSILRALRAIVGETDTLLPADQKTRARLLREHGRLDGFSFEARATGRRRLLPGLIGLHRHAQAKDVRAFIGPKLFDDYLVVTSERNPWDRQVSLYAHRHREQSGFKLDRFDRDMRSPFYNFFHYNRLNNWSIYTIDDTVCADLVIRYENLAEDFRVFLNRVGIPLEKAALTNARASERPRDHDYRQLYSQASQALVAGWYRREIDRFGYTFAGD